MDAVENRAVHHASVRHPNTKTHTATSRSAAYYQRRSPLQVELSNATRLFQRQLEKAKAGKQPTLSPPGQRQTTPPRRWCIIASLFGGEECHPMYVRGALRLAADLPQPWSLWLAVDNATMLAWGELLSAAANIHMVVVRRQQEQDIKRRRRAEGWAVNMFTRYLLLDDASLAGAVIGDLDVEEGAATSQIKLWRTTDASCDDQHKVAFGVVSYPVGASRGMEGRRTTWNGGAMAMAKREQCNLGFSESISTFIGDKADELQYGCDETWLGNASPVRLAYVSAQMSVLEIQDGSTKVAPILPGVPRRPQVTPYSMCDCVVLQTPGVEKCLQDVKKLASQLRQEQFHEQKRMVHALLTSPSTSEHVVKWVTNTCRHGKML